jgi:hypothetical protein
VRAIEALGLIEPSGWFERVQVSLLLAAYRRRLRGIVGVVPGWAAEKILTASELAGEQKVTVWRGKN